MSTTSNYYAAQARSLAATTGHKSGHGDKLKWALAAGAFALAALIGVWSRPAPVRVNAAIISVVGENDVDGVRDAIAKDPSQINAVDIDGNTPLHIAAQGGYGQMVDELIAAGADVNLPNRAGWTPLASALLSSKKDQLGIVHALLAAGANANASTSGGQALAQLAKTIPTVDPKVIGLLGGEGGRGADAPAASRRDGSAYASVSENAK